MPLRFADGTMWRASVPPSGLTRLLSSLPADNERSSRMWHASLADGRIRMIESPEVNKEKLAASLQDLRMDAESLGGSLIIESAPDEIKGKIDAWGDLGSRRDLMARIKQQLDPHLIFSPGRFANL